MSVLVGQHELVDQDLGRSGFHGRNDLLQDLAAGFVGVVVEDLVEEVGVGGCCCISWISSYPFLPSPTQWQVRETTNETYL